MYTNNHDTSAFSLNHNAYDEEEYVESDEYYDGEGEEEYYDDDEYGEEEYYDDGYADAYQDEGAYYDDAYNHPVARTKKSDTLNKILDEIAALKRSVAMPHVVPVAAPPPPQHHVPVVSMPVAYHHAHMSHMPHMPYVISPFAPMATVIQPNAPITTVIQPSAPTPVVQPNNEMAIYNELARLREDLSKTQSSQQMHVEVSRLKDTMRMDAKINESRLHDEIYRLNRQLADLQRGKSLI